MSLIVTADLHFTDQPKDAHRWALLPWLQAQARKHQAEAVLLLGDLTDAKDKHSAALTNQMVQGLRNLAKVVPVYVARGNHDYIDEKEPFFGFMDHAEDDDGPRIRFFTKPTTVRFRGVGECLFLPNTRDYEKDWADLDLRKPRYIFTHQTYDGCLTENGTKLEGIPPSFFKNFRGQVWSGDIHKPQQVGSNIWYVGAPYRCRFGDDYTPRVVLINDDGTHTDLHFPTTNKVLVELDVDSEADVGGAWHQFENDHKLYEGDQVKVRVRLPRASYPEWPAIKAAIVAKAKGLVLFGPELVPLADAPAKASGAKGAAVASHGRLGPAGHVDAYATKKGASADLRAAGHALLKQALGG